MRKGNDDEDGNQGRERSKSKSNSALTLVKATVDGLALVGASVPVEKAELIKQNLEVSKVNIY